MCVSIKLIETDVYHSLLFSESQVWAGVRITSSPAEFIHAFCIGVAQGCWQWDRLHDSFKSKVGREYARHFLVKEPEQSSTLRSPLPRGGACVAVNRQIRSRTDVVKLDDDRTAVNDLRAAFALVAQNYSNRSAPYLSNLFWRNVGIVKSSKKRLYSIGHVGAPAPNDESRLINVFQSLPKWCQMER